MKIPNFENKEDLFNFLKLNQKSIIAAKKAQIKRADGVSFVMPASPNLNVIKSPDSEEKMSGDLQILAVINTTNILDSHCDVHIPGLWNKSLSENKYILHLQEHEMEFEKIISDGNDLKAFTKNITWKELGFNYEGKTEALIFDSYARADRNPYMIDQYRKGYVRNHSVGMQYVKLVMCINRDTAGAEWEAWQKYFPMVVNKKDAEARGYFFAVTEAKVIEGSAVPRGSNIATPTLSTQEKEQPSYDTVYTDNEPINFTQSQQSNTKKNLLLNLIN